MLGRVRRGFWMPLLGGFALQVVGIGGMALGVEWFGYFALAGFFAIAGAVSWWFFFDLFEDE